MADKKKQNRHPKTASEEMEIDQSSDISGQVGREDQEGSNNSSDDRLFDPDHTIDFSRKLIRVQYPAVVKNVNRALETLGGINNIERVVSNQRNPLELRFHPNNQYSKPSVADRDFKTGILLKVKAKIPKNKNLSPIFEYSFVGVTAQNFTFNRLCDFQYLPLLSKTSPETKESDVENIYRSIVPEGIPDINFFRREESQNMPLHLTPAAYARFDNANARLFLETGERFESAYRPEIAKAFRNPRPEKSVAQTIRKKHSLSLTVNYTGGKVPDKTPDYIMQQVKERRLKDLFRKVSKLFDERPIYTKAAVIYITKLTLEQSKVIIPAVAYYVRTGPWRSTWIRYGYDPRKDPKSRVYQTLDYRIRTAEGSKQKIALKRKALACSDYPGLAQKKISLQDELLKMDKPEIGENCYILTPTTLPPARQLFYQYCDLKLPEIETMLSRLPLPSPDMKPDPKNGWLPASFTEQCREIVNKYILETVKREMLRENEETTVQSVIKSKSRGTQSEYCSKMLSNIRKGIYTQIPIASVSTAGSSRDPDGGEGSYISYEELSDRDEDEDEITFETTAEEHIERTIPETLDEDLLDDEDDDNDSTHTSNDDINIDLEALEEVNQLIEKEKVATSEGDINFTQLKLTL